MTYLVILVMMMMSFYDVNLMLLIIEIDLRIYGIVNKLQVRLGNEIRINLLSYSTNNQSHIPSKKLFR